MSRLPWFFLLLLVACGQRRSGELTPMPLPRTEGALPRKHTSMTSLPLPADLLSVPAPKGVKGMTSSSSCTDELSSWEDWLERLFWVSELDEDGRSYQLEALEREGLLDWRDRLDRAMLLGEGQKSRQFLIKALDQLDSVVAEAEISWTAAAFATWLHKKYRLDLERLTLIQRQARALRAAKRRNRELAEKLAALTSIEKEMSKGKEEQRP